MPNRLPRLLGLILFAALLPGCATHNQLLKPDARSGISEVHVQFVIPQEGFTFSAASPGVAAVGGLIPALIDASIQKSRQQNLRARISPLLDRLLDADFREQASAVAVQPPRAFPLKIVSLTVVPQMPTSKQTQALHARLPQAAAVMRVLFHYEIDHVTLVITTRSYAILTPRGGTERLYAGSIAFQARPLAPDFTPADLESGMRESVTETLRLLALDMSQLQSDGSRPKSTGNWRNGITKVPVNGELLGDTDSRVALRDAAGNVLSVAKE